MPNKSILANERMIIMSKVARNVTQDKSASINDGIAGQIASSDVILFTKGSAAFPQSGFSAQVVSILEHLLDVAYVDREG